MKTEAELQASLNAIQGAPEPGAASPEAVAPVEAAPVGTPLVDQSGKVIHVEDYDVPHYLAQGYTRQSDLQAPEASPESSDVLGGRGFWGGLLSRAEASAGAAGTIPGMLAQGAVSALSGYQGPRAESRGLDAPISDKSTFRLGYEDAARQLAEREENLGAEKYAWNLAGLAAQTIATGGANTVGTGLLNGPAAQAILRATPNAVLDRLGMQVAGKIIGQAAVAGALKTAAARGASGALQGAVGSALETGAREAPRFVDDPTGAAEDVGMAALYGGAGGLVLGGGLGFFEGLFSKANRVAQKIDLTEKPWIDPQARNISVADAAAEAAQRPLRSAEVPTPQRSEYQGYVAAHKALAGEADATIDDASRMVRENDDTAADLYDLFHNELGVAGKQRAMRAVQEGQIDLTPTGVLDPKDVAHQQAWSAAEATFNKARQELTDHDTVLHGLKGDVDGLRKSVSEAEAHLDELKAAKRPSGPDEDIVAARARLQAAKEALTGTEPTITVPPKPEAPEGTPKTATNPLLKERQKAVKEADRELQRLTQAAKAGRESAEIAQARKEIVARKKALSDAEDMLKHGTKNRDVLLSNAFQAEGKLRQMQAPSGPPRVLSRVENEARIMFDEIDGRIQEMIGRLGTDAKGLPALLEKQRFYRGKFEAAAKAGDFPEAFNIVDQGIKRAFGTFIDRVDAEPAAIELARGLYKLPETYLENKSLFGELADIQRTINKPLSTDIYAQGDSHVRALRHRTGLVSGVDEFAAKQRMESGRIKGLLSSLGDPASESGEEAYRRSIATRIASIKATQEAIGNARTAKLADDIVKRLTHNLDMMDGTAVAIRDRAAGNQLVMDNGLKASGLAAIGPTLTSAGTAAAFIGAPHVGGALATLGTMAGLSGISGKWFLSTIARYRGKTMNNIIGAAVNAAKYGSVGLEKAAKAAPRVMIAPSVSIATRNRTIEYAHGILTPGSPQAAQLVKLTDRIAKHDPKFAEALGVQAINQAHYLVSKIPVPPSKSVLAPSNAYIPPAQRASLDRTIHAMTDPDAMWVRIGNGIGTPEDIDAASKLYPQTWANFQSGLNAELEASKDRPRTRSSQVYLSKLLGKPANPTLERLAAIQQRAQAASHRAEDNGKSMEGGAANTPRGPMKLDTQKYFGNRSDRILSGS